MWNSSEQPENEKSINWLTIFPKYHMIIKWFTDELFWRRDGDK